MPAPPRTLIVVDSENDAAITRAVTTMAHGLNPKVVAEGAENEAGAHRFFAKNRGDEKRRTEIGTILRQSAVTAPAHDSAGI